MKNSIKIMVLLVLIGVQAGRLMAQSNSTGIYLTVQDYKAGKVSYTNATSLKLHGFLGGPHISLMSAGKKIRLSKAGIYGYRLNGDNYRFYGNEAYLVLDTAGFILYSHAQLAPQGKGYVTAIQYFYSVNQATPVTGLTIANICKSFPDQTELRYSLETYFGNNAGLAAYDAINKQYQIKYLYFEHQRQAGKQHAFL